jgi:hypothetical protein
MNSESFYGSDFNRFLKIADSERLVLTFQDGTRATIVFQTVESNCEVLIEHEFIAGKETVKTRTVFWNELLAQVVSQVTR